MVFKLLLFLLICYVAFKAARNIIRAALHDPGHGARPAPPPPRPAPMQQRPSEPRRPPRRPLQDHDIEDARWTDL